MDYEIIVARYTENLDWLREVAHKAVVYNKGTNNLDNSHMFKQIINLPNVGREAHSYLYNIVHDWPTSNVVKVFVQGRISDHIPTEYIGLECKYIETLVEQARNYGISTNYKEHDFGINSATYDFNISDRIPGMQPARRYSNLGTWYTAMISPNFPSSMKWYVGAIFAVRADVIVNNKHGFYERLLRSICASDNMEEAHFFERSWYYIFIRD